MYIVRYATSAKQNSIYWLIDWLRTPMWCDVMWCDVTFAVVKVHIQSTTVWDMKFFSRINIGSEILNAEPYICYYFICTCAVVYYVRHSDRVYIAGGFNGQECLNTAECYDPFTRQWTMIAPMRNRRSGIGVIAHGRFVYAVGGFNGITRLNNGEVYNPSTNSWSNIAEMYSPRSNFGIEVRVGTTLTEVAVALYVYSCH